MKNSLIFMTLALLFACSCKKSNPEPDPPNDIENNMLKVVRSGVLIHADFVTGVLVDSTSTLTIIANFDEQASASLAISAPTSVGTYDFVSVDNGVPSAIYTTLENEGLESGESISGTLVITSYNAATKRIKGTFNFVLQSHSTENTFNFSEGVFDIVHL